MGERRKATGFLLLLWGSYFLPTLLESQCLGVSICCFSQYTENVILKITLMMKEMKIVLLNKVLLNKITLSFRELRNKDGNSIWRPWNNIAVSNKAYVLSETKSVGDPKIDLIRTINIPALVSDILNLIIVDFRKEKTKSITVLLFSSVQFSRSVCVRLFGP